jgi:hypothetical protein
MKKYNEMTINEKINWKNQLSCCDANKIVLANVINSVAHSAWFYSWLWLTRHNNHISYYYK